GIREIRWVCPWCCSGRLAAVVSRRRVAAGGALTRLRRVAAVVSLLPLPGGGQLHHPGDEAGEGGPERALHVRTINALTASGCLSRSSLFTRITISPSFSKYVVRCRSISPVSVWLWPSSSITTPQ